MSFSSSWADMVENLDDSRDGLNLLLKRTSVGSDDASKAKPGRKRDATLISKTPRRTAPPAEKAEDTPSSPITSFCWKDAVTGSSAAEKPPPPSQLKAKAVEKKRKMASEPTRGTDEATQGPASSTSSTVEQSSADTAEVATSAERPSPPCSWAAVVGNQEPNEDSNDEGEAESTTGSPRQTIAPLTERRIEQREKQLQRGKATTGYRRYVELFPGSEAREQGRQEMLANGMRFGEVLQRIPDTPDKTLKISTRRFAGLVRTWRRALHKYDPEGDASSPRADDA